MWLVAGPDSGWGVELSPGRHLVGRSSHCSVVVADAAIEAHHVVLDVADDGTFDVVQLAGRVSITVASNYFEVGNSRIAMGARPAASDLVLGVTVESLGTEGGVQVPLTADSLAIVGDHGDAVIRSLESQAAELGITTPRFVLAAPDDPILDGFPAVLEIGARWRGRLTTPDQTVRLHLAGARSCQGVGARTRPRTLT